MGMELLNERHECKANGEHEELELAMLVLLMELGRDHFNTTDEQEAPCCKAVQYQAYFRVLGVATKPVLKHDTAHHPQGSQYRVKCQKNKCPRRSVFCA